MWRRGGRVVLPCWFLLLFAAFQAVHPLILPAQTVQIDLSSAERAWIEAHPTVRLGVGRAFPPFQYMDKGEVFQGIASGYMKLLKQRLGLDLQVQKNLTWAQVTVKTRDRQIDAWACVARTPERAEYMTFTEPYLVFPWVLFTREDAPLIAGIRDLEEELKRHAREQDKLNARLRELGRVKSSIIINVSHELRTPLTSLLGFANLTRKTFDKYFRVFAENSEELTRRARRIEANLGIIEDEGRRLTRLINDFLDLSKIQSQSIQRHDEPTDVAALLRRVAASAEALLLDKSQVAF